MATTTQTFSGTGSQTQFSIAFPYRDTADVKATIDAVVTTAFSVSGSTVTFNSAPANGAAVIIYRRTSNDTIEADFQSGSALRAVDLNNNFEQVLFVTQESSDLSDTATTNASTAVTDAAAAVATSNTANTNSTNAVNTANTASTNASAAVTTANAADTNATAALNNSRESDGSGGFVSAITKANTAITTANAATTQAATAITDSTSAVTTANSASTAASSAVSTANTASTNATTALNTANSAATDAASAISTANSATTVANSTIATANTASTNATNAVNTANTAATNASTALSTANTASTNATNAVTTANAASTAVSNAAFYGPIANVAAIPGSPADQDRIEILDSTGIQSFSPLTGLPSGFTGSSDLTVRLQYSSSGSTWEWKQYFAEDPEARYATVASVNTKMPIAGGTFSGAVSFDDNVIARGDSTNGSGAITLNCEINTHGIKIKGPPHSAGASYTLVLPNSLRSTTSTIGTITDTAADIPTGSTAQRPSSPAAGQFRFNSTDSKFEGYDGSDWGEIGGGGAAIIDGGDFNSASSIAGASTQTFDGGEFT